MIAFDPDGAPTLHCDVCREVIVDHAAALLLWDDDTHPTVNLHVHTGACFLAADNPRLLSRELDRVLGCLTPKSDTGSRTGRWHSRTE